MIPTSMMGVLKSWLGDLKQSLGPFSAVATGVVEVVVCIEEYIILLITRFETPAIQASRSTSVLKPFDDQDWPLRP